MNWKLFDLSIFLCIVSATTQAGTLAFPPIFLDDPIKRFKPAEYRSFNLIERELNNLIARAGDPQINNIFCVSGFIFLTGNPLATVIWTNKNQLSWWEGTTDDQEREKSISLLFSPYSDLIKVVEDGAILSGPTTLNRSQAKAAIEDCEQYGQKFLVRPFTPVKEKNDEDDAFEDLGDL